MMAQSTHRRAVWWVKRDMRLTDNEALCRAVAECDEVLVLFVCEPSLYNAEETSAMHVFAWWQAVKSLQKSLARLGAELYIGSGEVAEVLAHIQRYAPFDVIYSHEETGSAITYRRDQSVASWIDQQGISWQEVPQNGVVRGLADRDKRSVVMKQRLFDTPPFAAPVAINGWSLPDAAVTGHLPEKHRPGVVTVSKRFPDYASLCARPPDARINTASLQTVTEEAALNDMRSFLSTRGRGYSGGISSPNSAFKAGSRLSVHLAWGTISIRYAFYLSNQRLNELQQYGGPDSFQWSKSLKGFQSRLYWHDHFIQRFESAPCMEHHALNPAYDKVQYENNPDLLQAWLNGQTGLPLVDACMRCLQESGFCNFRMRSMLVTTACFGLSQSWRVLQYPLAQIFYDYEPGIHFSQIQMQASIVGINTMRVYSPHKQLLDQDPECKFVKQWVPELREFDPERIVQYGDTKLGDYPAPVTDVQENTKAMKTQLTRIRKSPEGSVESERILLKHGSRLRRGSRSRQSTRKNSAQMKLDL